MQDEKVTNYSYFVCILTNLSYIFDWRHNCLYFVALVNTNCNLLTNGYLNFGYKEVPFVTTVVKHVHGVLPLQSLVAMFRYLFVSAISGDNDAAYFM